MLKLHFFRRKYGIFRKTRTINVIRLRYLPLRSSNFSKSLKVQGKTIICQKYAIIERKHDKLEKNAFGKSCQEQLMTFICVLGFELKL